MDKTLERRVSRLERDVRQLISAIELLYDRTELLTAAAMIVEKRIFDDEEVTDGSF